MAETTPKLKRVLSLGDLIIYGIILIQPVAALPFYGHANMISKGHAVTSILAAMVAMIFTAISYGRMANRYPAAGSAYTYVGKGLNPHLGFVAGWSMIMDYIFVPILCVIFTAITANHLMPAIPYYFWIFFFAALFTILNLNGIKVSSRTNWILMIIMSIVVFWFMGAAINYVLKLNGLAGLFTMKPVYNPQTFDVSALGSATALAALTYIGFDGLTTLSEEVSNPRRNVMLAAVLTCVITGIWSGAQVYLAQVAWPDWGSFVAGAADEAARNSALDKAIMTVANRVGGSTLDWSLTIILLIGSVGSGMGGQLGASRLLYAMGRDSVLPKKVFGKLGAKNANPNNNVLIIGAIALAGALLLNYEECARLINFGAFLAFMAVNIASIREYYFLSDDKSFRSFMINFLPAALGFVICLIIWLNLPLKTFVIGGIWMTGGLIFLAVRTSWFKKTLELTDFTA